MKKRNLSLITLSILVLLFVFPTQGSANADCKFFTYPEPGSPHTNVVAGTNYFISIQWKSPDKGARVYIKLMQPAGDPNDTSDDRRVAEGFYDNCRVQDARSTYTTSIAVITIPEDEPSGSGYYWKAQLIDYYWEGFCEEINPANVTITNDNAPTLIFEDNFYCGDEKTLPDETKWFPQLGNASWEYNSLTEKPLRWEDPNDENTAWMYSAKSDLSSEKTSYYYMQNNNLVLNAIVDSNDVNDNGPKVKCGYLMTGYPSGGNNPDGNPKYSGTFFNPQDGKLVLECKAKTINLKGASTWFAFWAFNENYAYNDNPADGTEVDFVEIPRGTGEGSWLNHSFNFANHSDTSISKSFNLISDPKSSDLCPNMDSIYHIWKAVWDTDEIEVFVDGQSYYTLESNIPSDPIQMMLYLTLEFKPNKWSNNAGDGRYYGDYVESNSDYRIMSQVFIDYVKVWQY